MIFNRSRQSAKIFYDRKKAVTYAHQWAKARNPKYYNFDKLGGDCTNFISQCLYAGSGVMNYDPNKGWYYINGNKRTASWTGVEFLYRFLTNNKGSGPYGEPADVKQVEIGDIVQLNLRGDEKFDHTAIVVGIGVARKEEDIMVATHTYDRDDYPVSAYNWRNIRAVHILGVRK